MKNRIRKILKENQVHWSKQYEPFRYKENAERLGGSLDWKEKDEWDEDELVK